MRWICLFIIVFIVLTANFGSAGAQTIQALSGNQVTVSAGSARGVTIGMKAKVMAWEGSGEQRHEVPIANIEVVAVSETACTAKILAVGQGYAVQKGMRVAFADKLTPPTAATPPKTSPAAGADNKAAAEKAAAGGVPEAVQRMTLMEKIGYAKKQLDDGNYERAVAVYELVAKEAPDDKPFAEDYQRAREAVARQRAEAVRRESERAELEKIRQNLDYYRTLVAGYERDGDLAKAIEYQQLIGRVDGSAAARDKLAELEYRLAVSKLPTPAYPEDIREIAAKYPERSRELQTQALQNAAAREAQAAEERQRLIQAVRERFDDALEQEELETAEQAIREMAGLDPDRVPELSKRLASLRETIDRRPKPFRNSLGMDFVWIEPGSFLMGSPVSEKGRDGDEGPQHDVTISRPFYMQETEVTQGQWWAVMGNNPSRFAGCDDCPVESVSWNDVQEFIRRLNQMDPGKKYRLPTEAEWEYACRAGSTGPRYGPLDNIAWYWKNSGFHTNSVMTKEPNSWGLYDMIGNVWEWCQDLHAKYSQSEVMDPTGPTSGLDRVFRGGSWGASDKGCRSAHREDEPPGFNNWCVGFRLARSIF